VIKGAGKFSHQHLIPLISHSAQARLLVGKIITNQADSDAKVPRLMQKSDPNPTFAAKPNGWALL